MGRYQSLLVARGGEERRGGLPAVFGKDVERIPPCSSSRWREGWGGRPEHSQDGGVTGGCSGCGFCIGRRKIRAEGAEEEELDLCEVRRGEQDMWCGVLVTHPLCL